MSIDYQAILKRGSTGVRSLPPTIVLYGEGGTGKTTFASKAKAPAFLCTEDGAHAIDGVTRYPSEGVMSSWVELLSYANALANGTHDFKTIVLDSGDIAVALCMEQLVKDSGKSNYDQIGYNKDKILALRFRELLFALERCRARGMMVIVICHATARKVDDPTIGGYSGFTGKMDKDIWGILYNWADIALFARKEKVLLASDTGKARALTDGTRYLHSESGTGFEAKQRAGYTLPAVMPLDWVAFEEALLTKGDDVTKRIAELIKEIGDADVTAKAQVFVTQAGGDVAKLRGIENGLKVKLSEKNKEKAA